MTDFEPRRLPNGHLLVPRRAEGDGVLGDGWVEIDETDPQWDPWLRRHQRNTRSDA